MLSALQGTTAAYVAQTEQKFVTSEAYWNVPLAKSDVWLDIVIEYQELTVEQT